MHSTYVVVGAGPAGLACALRLALSGDKVIICESHRKIGGLNSYYFRQYEFGGVMHKVVIDSGLHALTNYTVSTDKNLIFNRLMRSLKVSKGNYKFYPQLESVIKVKGKTLFFSNNIERLTLSIAENYPSEKSAWDNFLLYINKYNEFSPDQPSFISAKEELKNHFASEEFVNHLLFPVMTYGSPWEGDMDFNLFVCLFRSMFLEGLCRLEGGIQSWWNPILNKLHELNVTLLLGEKVLSITKNESGNELVVQTQKQTIHCSRVFSSAGVELTQSLIGENSLEIKNHQTKMAFCELFLIVEGDLKEAELPSLGFYSNEEVGVYTSTNKVFDNTLAVYCFPSRFAGESSSPVSQIRMTVKTNAAEWFAFEKEDYKYKKVQLVQFLLDKLYFDFPILKKYKIIFTDIFTPKTIHRYTGSPLGSIYGSQLKTKNGLTSMPGVYLIGADQGYPGIIGAMLSGVTMANIYGIMASNEYRESLS